MPRAEIERFLEGVPQPVAFDLATLLEEELPESNRLAVVECGDGNERSLLRYTDAGG